MIEIRCPGAIYRFNKESNKKEFVPCNALLCKANEGSKVEIVCHKCKSKVTAIVRPMLGQNSVVDIKIEK